jgi:PAS domain S-box-containing protein
MNRSRQSQGGEPSLEPPTTTRQALALLEAVGSSSRIAIGLATPEGRYLLVNNTFSALVGATVEEMMRTTIAERRPEFWRRIEPVFQHVITTGETVRNLPVSMGSPDDTGGSPQWLFSYDPVRDGDAIVGVAIHGVDVTESVRSEELHATVMNEVAEGVMVENRRGLVYMNRAASRLLGWTEAELRGRRIHDAIHYQRADGTPISFDECVFRVGLLNGQIRRASNEAFTRKDGSTFPVACSVVPLYIGSKINRIVAVFRDLTDAPRPDDVICVLIATAEPSTRAALGTALDGQAGMEIAATVASAAAAVDAAKRLSPDVVLLDEELSELDGAPTARRITAEAPAASVIIMSGHVDESVVISNIASGGAGALDLGRIGEDALGAVQAAYRGEMPVSQPDLQQQLVAVRRRRLPELASDLTAREREVLGCIMQGLSNPATAERLGVTTNTVRNHVQRVLWKLNVHSKLEAVVVATREGLLQSEM